MTPGDVTPRWVGTGWTVFNNKGKPVRQYEPFFTDTHHFEFDIRIGVSPIVFYDPIERKVAGLNPNHTWEKIVFDSWKQASWDVNDTVKTNPKTDLDVGDFFSRLPDTDYLPTWYDQRISGTDVQEKTAAEKTAIHAETATIAHFDSLGRTFLTIAHNKFKRSDAPAGDPPIEEFHLTRTFFDIEGNKRQIKDANECITMLYDYDILSTQIHQSSMEAGERWMLNDVLGKPIRAWDSRDHRFRTVYDQLRRSVESYMQDGVGTEVMIGQTVYGESRPNPETKNLREKTVQVSDQAGVITSEDYDFKGNLLSTSRQLAVEYKTTLNWSASVTLETGTFTTSTSYDALNRPIQVTTPDTSIIHSSFNEANLLETVEVNLRGAVTATPFITNIDYNAKGQRALIDFGNGARTTYVYDPFTFRLTRLLTRRDPAAFTDCPTPAPTGWPGCQVQNLSYTFDPIGNITHISDDAQQQIYFSGVKVEPSSDYTYDAIYRLIEANGREHLGQTGMTPNPPTVPDAFNAFHMNLDHPNDGNAMGKYWESYIYDFVGNITSMQHVGTDPANPGWTRKYVYDEDSQLETGKKNNRLTKTIIGTTVEPCKYDGSAGLHGNITSMFHLPLMQWDYHDQLQATAKQVRTDGGTPVTTWYVYDSHGQRVRKVTDNEAAPMATPVRMNERVYLGGFEIYREYTGGTTITLERESLHVMDDKKRIAMIETRTDTPMPSEQLTRYQYDNHLGSASLELDETGKIISYEEYYPYGSTSYQGVRSKTETPKRYRYTGKERDEENGFNYHGARYYAPWLGRWTKPDPAGLIDGPNLYRYSSNPINFIDLTGTEEQPTIPQRIKEALLNWAPVRDLRSIPGEIRKIQKADWSQVSAKEVIRKIDVFESHESRVKAFATEYQKAGESPKTAVEHAKSTLQGFGGLGLFLGAVVAGPLLKVTGITPRVQSFARQQGIGGKAPVVPPGVDPAAPPLSSKTTTTSSLPESPSKPSVDSSVSPQSTMEASVPPSQPTKAQRLEQQALVDMAEIDSKRIPRGKGPVSTADADTYIQLANEVGVTVRAKQIDLTGAHGYGPVPAGPEASHIHIREVHVPVPPGYTPPPGSKYISK
jgi:RHS repeat-associated protein